MNHAQMIVECERVQVHIHFDFVQFIQKCWSELESNTFQNKPPKKYLLYFSRTKVKGKLSI